MPNCVIEESTIGDNSIICLSPLSMDPKYKKIVQLDLLLELDPQTVISNNARIGNFVEIKSS